MKRMIDTSDEWRSACLYVYSPVFNQLVDKLQTISVKPGYSARALEREIAKDLSCKPSQIYLVAQLDAE
jgi:hypothetical protein